MARRLHQDQQRAVLLERHTVLGPQVLVETPRDMRLRSNEGAPWRKPRVARRKRRLGRLDGFGRRHDPILRAGRCSVNEAGDPRDG